MNKEESKKRLVEEVQKKLGNDYLVTESQRMENNDTVYDTIKIQKFCFRDMPGISIHPFMARYHAGDSMEHLAEQVIKEYQKGKKEKILQASWLNDWEQMKERLVYRLVNPNKNKNFLQDVFTLPFLDLAVAFFVIVNQEIPEEGRKMDTIPVTVGMAKRWNRNQEEILEQGRKNMEQYSPNILYEFRVSKRGRNYEMAELETEEEIIIPEDGMLVLTNKAEKYGASAMINTKYLERIAELLHSDFYLLPSSVHETILYERKGKEDLKEIKKFVYEANRKLVLKEEVLSDSIYLFERNAKQVKIAA